MTIHSTGGHVHWNYFLALERDLELVSRYIEFTEGNFETYSIELAHLLLASASEVDVVAKLLCEQVAPGAPSRNMDEYRSLLSPVFAQLPTLIVRVPRYGLSFAPWANWGRGTNPDWWRSYNKVKHERNEHFAEATLQNALNAIGALLIFVHHYYMAEFARSGRPPEERDISHQLAPGSSLLRLPEAYYYDRVYM